MRFLVLAIIATALMVGCAKKKNHPWQSDSLTPDKADKITIVFWEYTLDGGTTTLCAITDSGQMCAVRLNQHAIEGYADPGRLFFNGDLIEVRSEEEKQILNLLKNADIKPLELESIRNIAESPIESKVDFQALQTDNTDDSLARFRESMVAYIESDEYVTVAENGLPERVIPQFSATE